MEEYRHHYEHLGTQDKAEAFAEEKKQYGYVCKVRKLRDDMYEILYHLPYPG